MTPATEPLVDAAQARDRLLDAQGELLGELFRPPPLLSVADWADRYRWMAPEETPEPGKWRTGRVPYLREIMNAGLHPGVERVVVQKAGQIGITEVLKNVLAYFVDQDPSPLLVVLGSLDEARKWSKKKLAPMLDANPRLRAKVADAKARSSDNTILSKSFPGGDIALVGATSPKGLRSLHRRVLLMDEVDSYPASAGTEGDPVKLAEKRTETYRWRRVIYLVSTPTDKGFSRIEDAFQQSDQRYYYVPCPHCGTAQTLRWAAIHYEDNDPETAVLICGAQADDGEFAVDGCGAVIEERHKPVMLQEGTWRSHAPDAQDRGYHVNSLYSPFLSWSKVVREHLEALAGGQEQRKSWVNGYLGETWETGGSQVDPGPLQSRTETYPPGVERIDQLEQADWRVPGTEERPKVGLLTAAVDVQGDRLELLVKGWGGQEESWQIAWERIEGDPGDQEVWDNLEYFLTYGWPHRAGGELYIQACAIDIGGHHTESVYEFVEPRQQRGVMAIQGSNTDGYPILGKPTNKGRGESNRKVKLFKVGTVAAKDLIFSRLQFQKPGPGYVHFPDWLDAEYFEQLTAEKVRTKYRRGRPIRRYEKQRPRNEALDLEVYALAALRSLPKRIRDNLGDLAERVAEGASVAPRGSRRRRRKVRSRGVD